MTMDLLSMNTNYAMLSNIHMVIASGISIPNSESRVCEWCLQLCDKDDSWMWWTQQLRRIPTTLDPLEAWKARLGIVCGACANCVHATCSSYSNSTPASMYAAHDQCAVYIAEPLRSKEQSHASWTPCIHGKLYHIP